ncbi:MAG: hypothetical protein K0R83_251, partial [Caulobacter sp.]|nr:hypothetical protein [Caulobacter sp.]
MKGACFVEIGERVAPPGLRRGEVSDPVELGAAAQAPKARAAASIWATP